MLENDNSYAQSPGLTQINKQMIEQIHNINLNVNVRLVHYTVSGIPDVEGFYFKQ